MVHPVQWPKCGQSEVQHDFQIICTLLQAYVLNMMLQNDTGSCVTDYATQLVALAYMPSCYIVA